jgi:hypothetical protein
MENTNNYVGYYRSQLESSLEYQDFVMEKLYEVGFVLNCYSSGKYQNKKGESRSGIEVKFDDQMKKTGNIYIEYAEKSHPNNKNYVPSGIERIDNTCIVAIGDYNTIYLIAKNWLQQFKKLKDTIHVSTSTSKGYLFPRSMAQKYAIKIINC